MANLVKRAAYQYRGMGTDQMIGVAMADGELVSRIMGMLGAEHPFSQGLLMALEGQRRVDAAPRGRRGEVAEVDEADEAAFAIAAPAPAAPPAPKAARAAAAPAAPAAPAAADVDARIAAAVDPLRQDIAAILAHLSAPRRSRKA